MPARSIPEPWNQSACATFFQNIRKTGTPYQPGTGKKPTEPGWTSKRDPSGSSTGVIFMATQAASQVVLRAMTAGDLDAATELSREQGWPHREEDWALFLELGEGLVAELDGRVTGTAMGWRFGADFATMGSIIVSNASQGRGIGRKLTEAVLERLAGRNVVLNATEDGLPLYAKLGFVETGTVFQHQAVAPAVPLAELVPGERVRPMGAADDCLADMYSRACGMDRSALLGVLTEHASTVVLTRDHTAVGFAQFRRFGRGWSVGPVVAPDQGGAKALISHWLGANTGSFCRIDVTADSGLSPWLEDLGLPCVGTVRTMVRGNPPITDPDVHAYALVAQALG
jgi:predicted N-acetyltransferase YhbS